MALHPDSVGDAPDCLPILAAWDGATDGSAEIHLQPSQCARARVLSGRNGRHPGSMVTFRKQFLPEASIRCKSPAQRFQYCWTLCEPRVRAYSLLNSAPQKNS